jgi:uncharacterized protein (DUF1501 family)
MNHPSNDCNSRRDFLKLTSTLSLAGLAASHAPNLLAATDYRALVCVFLYGGNDANNMIIPFDAPRFQQYAAVRGNLNQGGIGIPREQLVALAGKNGSNADYALHPALAPLKSIWDGGKMALMLNTGSLVEPVTKAEYKALSKKLPAFLFSHSDQQVALQTAAMNGFGRQGWGGRMMDQLAAANPLATISTAGNVPFTVSIDDSGVAVPSSGGFGLSLTGDAVVDKLYQAQLKQARSLPNALERITGLSIAETLSVRDRLNPILSATSPTAAVFAGQNNGLANQLMQVAKLIEARQTLGVNRQVFFVGIGGYDTHDNQASAQQNNYTMLGNALKSFYDAMNGLNVGNQVTTFTLSDFGRTFKPNANKGSDHGWGSHHLVLGGAVKGQQAYGKFPDLALNGADDIGEGRWVPTTSLDQYGATLAQWLGVNAATLPTIFPNLNAFAVKNLGLMG